MSNSGFIGRIRSPPQLSTSLLVCFKVLMCAMPIAQIAIGAVYLDECPVQRYIPIFLVVLGVFSLVLSLLICLPCAQQPKDGPPNPLSRLCTAWNSLVSFFGFCWFIAGNVWIYSIYQPDYNKNATVSYCHKTVYLFAFWNVTLVYISFGLCLLGCCCMLCGFFLRGQADPDDDI